MRQRSGSVKRKPDDAVSYANVTSGSARQINPEKLENISVNISKVNSICDKVDSALISADESPLKDILSDLCAAVKLINNNQEEIVKEQLGQATIQNQGGMVNIGTIPKRNRPLTPSPLPQTSFNVQVPHTDTVTEPEKLPEENVSPEQKKFKEAVRKAESSSLIFNLNLGKVPILNVETMSTRATLALAAMAAEHEKRPGNIPSDDSIAAIDDVLSLAKNIEFYGRKTKTYTNSRDPKSGSYCTIPIRYEFADKNTRIEAETYLRNNCDVHCSTPYPSILRECIRQVTDTVRKDYPDNQVKILVDTDNFCLKVAKRPSTEGPNKNRWDYYKNPIPLPVEALDVEARKVPDGFKFVNFPVRRNSGREDVAMGGEEAGEAVAGAAKAGAPGSAHNSHEKY
jgi:hypothetical protein